MGITEALDAVATLPDLRGSPIEDAASVANDDLQARSQETGDNANFACQRMTRPNSFKFNENRPRKRLRGR
jgi:hypothetical protein